MSRRVARTLFLNSSPNYQILQLSFKRLNPSIYAGSGAIRLALKSSNHQLQLKLANQANLRLSHRHNTVGQKEYGKKLSL